MIPALDRERQNLIPRGLSTSSVQGPSIERQTTSVTLEHNAAERRKASRGGEVSGKRIWNTGDTFPVDQWRNTGAREKAQDSSSPDIQNAVGNSEFGCKIAFG